MRKIAIVGAGQAGMVLAFGLLDEGYDVTVLESRTPEQIEHGPILSTAMVFDRQLDTERRLGLHAWEEEAPVCNGMHATLRLPNGEVILQVQGGLDETCQGVDARIKSSTWMRRFERRGGKLVIANVDPPLLDALAKTHDLVVVSSGRGGQLAGLFERDPERTLFDGPPRRLGAVILKNVHEWEEVPYTPLKFQFCMEAGDYFAIPFYSWSGPCRAVVFEAPAGSFMDRFGPVTTGEEALAAAKAIIRDLTPQDWPNYKDAELVDSNSWLKGAITPTVRKPVGRLASGRSVLALGDAAIVNDPISGAGANDAVRMADRLLAGIVERGGLPFTADWMQEIFEAHYQEHGRHTMRFTKIMTEPITDPAWKVLQAAARSPGVAHTFVNVYTDIQKSLGWLTDMEAADAVCRQFPEELSGVRFLTMAEARARFMPQSAAA